jgi:alkylation response protein AidB-like acyl-CoA dehydrogenase
MHLALTDEQEALRAAVGTLLDRRSSHTYDPGLWATLCGEIGVAALAFPEEFGGAGAGLVETCVVAEELGRTLTPSPLLGSVVLAGHALLAGGDAEACARLLPGLADGSRLAAVAMAGPGGHWRPANPPFSAVRDAGADWTLTGEAHYVLDGDTADVLLVAAAADDGIGLFEVPVDSARRAGVTTMDQTRRLAVVGLTDAPGRRLAGDGEAALRAALDAAHVVLAAEQVGAAAECLRRTVEYSKARVQFGRPIGGFQALQHRMADLHVTVETARSAARAAAVAPDPTTASVASAVASVYCSEALGRVAAEMIQLHGGIAITWEHEAHLYFKRAHSSAHLFGRPAEHVTRLADLVGITP